MKWEINPIRWNFLMKGWNEKENEEQQGKGLNNLP
jgi:hypothetical protein